MRTTDKHDLKDYLESYYCLPIEEVLKSLLEQYDGDCRECGLEIGLNTQQFIRMCKLYSVSYQKPDEAPDPIDENNLTYTKKMIISWYIDEGTPEYNIALDLNTSIEEVSRIIKIVKSEMAQGVRYPNYMKNRKRKKAERYAQTNNYRTS